MKLSKKHGLENLHRKSFSLCIIFLMASTVLISNFFIIEVHAEVEEIKPEFGDAPKIDGYINSSAKEWANATKINLNLYTNGSETDKGLSTKLWALESGSDLFISVQFNLEDHEDKEFVGLLISKFLKDDNYDIDDFDDTDFKDAKIVQFDDIEDDDYDYYDYNIDDGDDFDEDKKSHGDGAAELDGETVIYEFSMPVNNTKAEDDSDDIFLDYGESYAFKIVYGEDDSYPDGIKKSNIVLIKIEYPEAPPPRDPWLDIHNVLCIIIFIGLTAVFGFYVYRVVYIK